MEGKQQWRHDVTNVAGHRIVEGRQKWRHNVTNVAGHFTPDKSECQSQGHDGSRTRGNTHRTRMHGDLCDGVVGDMRWSFVASIDHIKSDVILLRLQLVVELPVIFFLLAIAVVAFNCVFTQTWFYCLHVMHHAWLCMTENYDGVCRVLIIFVIFIYTEAVLIKNTLYVINVCMNVSISCDTSITMFDPFSCLFLTFSMFNLVSGNV